MAAQWMSSICLPKPSPLQTPSGVGFSLWIEGGSITIGKQFLLRFNVPKSYTPGSDDFIGLYDSTGTLIDWYKATEERRNNGLLWAPESSRRIQKEVSLNFNMFTVWKIMMVQKRTIV